MSSQKIPVRDIPEIRSGDCSKDPTIMSNHAEVMRHMCTQLEFLVIGINDYIDRTDRSSDRIIKKVDDLQSDVSRWHEEFALTARDLEHLESDVERLGTKVRKSRGKGG